MTSKNLRLFSLFFSLAASGIAQAGYDCSVTALEQGSIKGELVRDFYPINVPVAGARVVSQEYIGMQSGALVGEDFILESKKSKISFVNFLAYSPDAQEAKFIFTRHSNPNRHKVMTEHESLGEIYLHGSESKIIDIDGGRYRVTIVCANRLVVGTTR